MCDVKPEGKEEAGNGTGLPNKGTNKTSVLKDKFLTFGEERYKHRKKRSLD